MQFPVAAHSLSDTHAMLISSVIKIPSLHCFLRVRIRKKPRSFKIQFSVSRGSSESLNKSIGVFSASQVNRPFWVISQKWQFGFHSWLSSQCPLSSSPYQTISPFEPKLMILVLSAVLFLSLTSPFSRHSLRHSFPLPVFIPRLSPSFLAFSGIPVSP